MIQTGGTTATMPGSCLSLGRSECAEFQPLWQALQQLTEPRCWRSAETLSAFLDEQRTEAHRVPIEFAVVWQSWSDEYPPAEIAALLAALPLCRVVCVTGPWCEADARTRRAWPPGLAVPWWRAGSRLQHELKTTGNRTASALSWTASREEVWLYEQETRPAPVLTDVTVALHVSDSAFFGMLQAALVSVGANVAESSANAVDFALVDVDPWTDDRAETVRQIARKSLPAPVLGLTGWPTADLSQAAEQCGVSELIPKLEWETLFHRMTGE